MKKLIIFSFICTIFFINGYSQKVSNEVISQQIIQYKNDVRGPYKDIRWFCKDGSIRQPKDPCPDNIGPGVQHARYKDAVEQLAKTNNLYFGQILAYSDKDDFWDVNNYHSRLKQYQLDKYLRAIDNGWINEKGQFYRGAIQSEDEEAWGIDFYKWLLKSDENLKKNYFLIRQSLKDIPHNGDDNLSQLMRSQSKVISDEFLPFMDLRVKIHGQPEFSDIAKVKSFKEKYSSKLSNNQVAKIDALVITMSKFYKPIDIKTLVDKNALYKSTAIGEKISGFVNMHDFDTPAQQLIPETAELVLAIRESLLDEKRPLARLQLLDLSVKLEEIIFKTAPQWEPKNVQDMLNKVCYLGMATAGSGYLELSEWDNINLKAPFESDGDLTLSELTNTLENARSLVEWSASMVKANYQHIVDVYTAFEPKAYGFIDDKIRGSIALQLGESVGELGDFIANESALTNKVMDISNQSSFRGLNPGYTFGELVVVDGSPDAIEVESDHIY
ncbi:MAG: phosphoenolpyruvate synthase, partial [Algibacter sp.]